VVFANIAATAATDTNTVALLHGDGSNNSTTITDSSNLAANWTAAGNAKLSTGTKKFGTASISFDGSSSSYIYPTAASSNFAYPGDFTIEFWLYASSLTSSQVFYDGRPAGTNGAYPTIYYSGTSLNYLANSSIVITGSALSTSTWYHIAVCRSGTTTRMFIDGTQTGSSYTSDTTSYLGSTSRPYLGASSGFGADAALNGFMDDIRITKGQARYTANFTAPTAAFTNPTPATNGSVTLPTATGGNKNLYSISNIHATDTLQLATTSSQTINGSAPGTLAAGAKLTVVSDGSNWRSPW
jgi:hypothetical protein